jgi:hypothetical protein
MASDHWSGTFAEARERTGGDESMPELNHSGKYDHIRCPVCARPWPEHPEWTICNRHRPVIAPHWVAEALAQHERARDAVCAAANGKPTPEETPHVR